jgi:WD40 repeat protein
MQIKASFSEDGKYIISGSETGAVFIWNKVSPAASGSGLGKHGGGNNLSAVATIGGSSAPTRIRGVKPDRNKSYETFQAAKGSGAATTVAMFAPSNAVTKATKINPGVYVLDYVSDLCSRIIVTGTHDGCIYVYTRGLDA